MSEILSGAWTRSIVDSTSIAVGSDQNVPTPAWTTGGATIARLATQPASGQSWTISGWSVAFEFIGNIKASPAFGRLGKLIAGPSRRAIPTDGVVSFTGFPEDTSNLATIWDGSVDAPPAMIGEVIGALTPFEGGSVPAGSGPIAPNTSFLIQENLASPIELAREEEIVMCLFLTPSLSMNIQLAVLSPTFTVTYDTT